MIGLVKRLQSYLREKAHFDGRDHLSVPPFTLFFNPSVNDPKEGVAIPDEAATYSAVDVSRVCAAFVERGRVPCVQYVDQFAPGLTVTLSLSQHTFEEKLRLPIMYCTAGMLVHPPKVAGLVITMAGLDAPLEEIKDGWNVNSKGFDPEPVIATDTIAEEFRKTLVTSRSFVGRLHGEPVAAGMFEAIRDGLSELVGITTLESYRRRGIGAVLTADITRTAFDSGVEVVFLIAANEAAGRVYTRLGFLPIANLVEYEQEVKS